MVRGIIAVLCALLFGLAGTAAGQDPKEILNQVGAKYASLQSYDFQGGIVAETRSGAGTSTSENSFQFVLSRPDKIRVEYRYPTAGSWVRVSDGKTTARYRSLTKEFTESAATPDDFDVFIRSTPISAYELIAERVQSATLTGSETVAVGTDNIDCYVLEVQYEFHSLLPDTEPLPTKYWIDKKRMIVLKQVSGTRSKSQTGGQRTENISTTKFTVAKIDEPVADALFAFKPKEK